MEQRIADNIGPMLICFGDISYELRQEDRMPEESEEDLLSFFYWYNRDIAEWFPPWMRQALPQFS